MYDVTVPYESLLTLKSSRITDSVNFSSADNIGLGKIRLLEIENNSLRASLRSTQEELAPLKYSNPVPVTNPNANEVKELRAKISKLEEHVVKLQVYPSIFGWLFLRLHEKNQ